MSDARSGSAVFVHLASGIGNIVLATPLLVALHEMELTIDVQVNGDYAESADLLRDWSAIRSVRAESRPLVCLDRSYAHVIPAIPPFYWSRFASSYRALAHVVPRPHTALFYRNEQEYYLSFARALGYPRDRTPMYTLPIAPAEDHGVTLRTVALAPGCKTGEMAAKRWPHFPALADRLDDVVVVGTRDDLREFDGRDMRFAPHVRSFVDQLSLRRTAELLASAGVVVGNDSGLSHVAAAVGTPTIMLFGPTPDVALGHLPPNVRVMRGGLPCEPCWVGARLEACRRRVDCLKQLDVDLVAREVIAFLGRSESMEPARGT